MLERTQSYFFFGFLAIVAVASFLIAWPFLPAIIFAAALAVVFDPVFERLATRLNSRRIASWLTLLLVALIVLLPLSFIGVQVAKDARDLYHRVQEGGIQGLPAGTVIQDALSKISPSLAGSSEETLKGALNWTISSAGAFFAGTLNIFLSIFVGAIALYYFLVDGSKLRRWVFAFSPLPDKYDQTIMERLGQTMNSVIRGSLVIASIQGVLAGIGFAIFGVPNPALWGIVAAISALIPGVGTALVLAPAIGYLFLVGDTSAALGLLVWAALAVGLIDNFLGPKLIGRGVKIHPLAIFIAVLGGLSLFGPLGFLMGPLVLSLFFTLLDIYASIGELEHTRKN